MSTIHKVRVILDTQEDIFRDLELKADHTLEVLHRSILRAFNIDEGEMASFYHTDDVWGQGEEIPMLDMGSNPDAAAMDQVHVEDLLVRPGDRLLYVYDFLNMWTFFVEFIQTIDPEDGIEYPHVSLTFGEAPVEAPAKDFGGQAPSSGGGGLFGGAFDDEEEDDDNYDGDFHEDEWGN